MGVTGFQPNKDTGGLGYFFVENVMAVGHLGPLLYTQQFDLRVRVWRIHGLNKPLHDALTCYTSLSAHEPQYLGVDTLVHPLPLHIAAS